MKPLALVVDDNKITIKLLEPLPYTSGLQRQRSIRRCRVFGKVQEETPDATVLT